MSSPGITVARVLAGSWRTEPPAVDFDEAELASVEPQLLASGAAGLAWWRIRSDPALSSTAIGRRFNDAFRMHSLHARMHEEQLVRVLDALRSRGIDPLLLKGWDAAGMYPQRGMRPYGDIDLWVREEDITGAEAAAADLPDGYAVDLGHKFELSGSSLASMFAAARTCMVGETTVQVLSEEDRLRVLALHLLKSGGWRPSGLCDIAAALESRSRDFSWERCMTPDEKVAGWVRSALTLTGRLLGADLRSTPIGPPDPPRWLVRSFLRSWEKPWPEKRNALQGAIVLPSLAHPSAVLRGLPDRWPDPVSSSIAMTARFSRFPRFPLQAAYAATRLGRYLRTQGDR